jgi:OmpA-OmpF porin, OOP family
MRNRIVAHGWVALALSLAAATATADEFTGFYAGAGVLSAAVDNDAGFDDSDTGFKVIAGYSLGELLAVELGYMDGGTAEENQTLNAILVPASPILVTQSARLDTEVETKVINLSVVGNLPLTETFGLFGKLGYASIDTDVELTVVNPSGSSFTAFSDSDSEEEISYGIGAVYSFGPALQLRAEYEGFDVPNGSLDFISLSGVFRFR